MYMRHNARCVLIEIHFVNFDQAQTRHYEQRNKRSWETMSIVENEKEESCKIRNAFQNKYLNRSQTMKLSSKQWYRATTNLNI